MRPVTASARVEVTIEMDARGTWDTEATVEQVQDQARRSVLQDLATRLPANGLKIIGEPRVRVIVVSQ